MVPEQPKKKRKIKRIIQLVALVIIAVLLYYGSMYLVEYLYREKDVVPKYPSPKDTSTVTKMPWQWTQFHGPRRDNRSPETGLLKSWPKRGPKRKWKSDLVGRGHSSPTLADGYIYITGTERKTEALVCLDLTGRFQWRIEYSPAARRYPGARSTPTYDNGFTYVISGTGRLVCIDTRRAVITWEKDAYQEFQGRCGNFGVAESPLIVDDKIYYTPCGPQTTMVALDKNTGRTLWQSESINDVSAYVSSILIKRGTQDLILTVTGSYILGIDPDDGRVLWKYLYVPNPDNENLLGTLMVNAVTPLYHDGQIYVTSGYNLGGVALQLSQDACRVQLLWEDKTLDCHHGGVILHDGYIYGSSWITNANGNWVCLDWKTGKVMYEHHWYDKGSITFADNLLYCYEEEQGRLALVNPTPEKFDIVSSFPVSTERGENWAHPVICNATLYLRYAHTLLAYDLKPK